MASGKMRILGIETSCDETALSVLEFEGTTVRVLSEEISSQIKLHEAYGGVVPELAAREHLANLPIMLESTLSKAGTALKDIAAIAVTSGPGLKGCLLMGVGFAKGLALSHNIPLVGVNHIEGHILAPQIENRELHFPYLALVVSGGHTEIVHVQGVGKYHILARTMDDAAGEAFDKAANLLHFPYPGGPRLAALADQSRPAQKSRFVLPKVMREAEGFSFSGLKTAIALLVKREGGIATDEKLKGEICWVIQESIVDALMHKLKDAIHRTGIRSVAVTGGVSANKFLRDEVSKLPGVKAYFPSMTHCTDNGTMIAFVGGLRFLQGERSDSGMEVISRWPVEELRAPAAPGGT